MKVCVVGCGAVGSFFAANLATLDGVEVWAFDLAQDHVDAINANGLQLTGAGEVTGHLRATTDAAALRDADFIVVAVPTPIDDAHQPDFGPLLGASESVGRNLKRGATVVFESTVYPGATEEICVPVIERHANMRWKRASRRLWRSTASGLRKPGKHSRWRARVAGGRTDGNGRGRSCDRGTFGHTSSGNAASRRDEAAERRCAETGTDR